MGALCQIEFSHCLLYFFWCRVTFFRNNIKSFHHRFFYTSDGNRKKNTNNLSAIALIVIAVTLMNRLTDILIHELLIEMYMQMFCFEFFFKFFILLSFQINLF